MKIAGIQTPEALGDGKPPNLWLLAWAAAFVLSLLAGIVYFEGEISRPTVAGPLTAAERLEIIDSKWDATPRTVTTECPTVSALEREAPQLRGVDARERDYVAFVKGARCS